MLEHKAGEDTSGYYIAVAMVADCGHESENSGVRVNRELADMWAVEHYELTKESVGIFRLVAYVGDGPCADAEEGPSAEAVAAS